MVIAYFAFVIYKNIDNILFSSIANNQSLLFNKKQYINIFTCPKTNSIFQNRTARQVVFYSNHLTISLFLLWHFLSCRLPSKGRYV